MLNAQADVEIPRRTSREQANLLSVKPVIIALDHNNVGFLEPAALLKYTIIYLMDGPICKICRLCWRKNASGYQRQQEISSSTRRLPPSR